MNWHTNPIERDETPDQDDTRRLCGCQHPQCWLVEDDPTNVLIDGKWFSCDCVGICKNCNTVDDLHNLLKAGGGRLVHERCPDAAMAAGREREARIDIREGK